MGFHYEKKNPNFYVIVSQNFIVSIFLRSFIIGFLSEFIKTQTNCESLDDEFIINKNSTKLLCHRNDAAILHDSSFIYNYNINIIEPNVQQAMDNQIYDNLISTRTFKTKKSDTFLSKLNPNFLW